MTPPPGSWVHRGRSHPRNGVGFFPSTVLPGSVLRVPHLVRSRQFKIACRVRQGHDAPPMLPTRNTTGPRVPPNVLSGHRKHTPGFGGRELRPAHWGHEQRSWHQCSFRRVRGVTRKHRSPRGSHSTRGPGVAVRVGPTDHRAPSAFSTPTTRLFGNATSPVLACGLRLSMFSKSSGVLVRGVVNAPRT